MEISWRVGREITAKETAHPKPPGPFQVQRSYKENNFHVLYYVLLSQWKIPLYWLVKHLTTIFSFLRKQQKILN